MNKIEALRTPDARFENLADFPFSENYATVKGDLRMHYLDENATSENVIVLLHGEPSWSFLYRKMIPVYVAAGYRVIAPDLIGFGKSDKPVHTADYTFRRHLDWVDELLFTHLDLKDINLFIQDWGGLIGLRLVAAYPEKFKTVVAGNTFLPTGQHTPNQAFLDWQNFSKTANPFPIGKVFQKSSVATLSEEVLAGYDAPFPDESYKAGAKIFPSLVPSSTDDPESLPNQKAWEQLNQFKKPFLTLFSDQDPIMKGLDKLLQQLIPGAKGQPHDTIMDAGHFLQEEKGEEIAEKMVKWLKSLDS